MSLIAPSLFPLSTWCVMMYDSAPMKEYKNKPPKPGKRPKHKNKPMKVRRFNSCFN